MVRRTLRSVVGGILFFCQLVLAMTHLHTKIEVSSFNRSGDRRGSQILKGGHVTRATPTLGAFYVCWLVLAMAQLHTKFEVSSFKCSGDTRGSQILKEGNTPTLGAFYVLSVSTGHNAATYQI